MSDVTSNHPALWEDFIIDNTPRSAALSHDSWSRRGLVSDPSCWRGRATAGFAACRVAWDIYRLNSAVALCSLSNTTAFSSEVEIRVKKTRQNKNPEFRF
jgi:hypothetical protein